MHLCAPYTPPFRAPLHRSKATRARAGVRARAARASPHLRGGDQTDHVLAGPLAGAQDDVPNLSACTLGICYGCQQVGREERQKVQATSLGKRTKDWRSEAMVFVRGKGCRVPTLGTMKPRGSISTLSTAGFGRAWEAAAARSRSCCCPELTACSRKEGLLTIFSDLLPRDAASADPLTLALSAESASIFAVLASSIRFFDLSESTNTASRDCFLSAASSLSFRSSSSSSIAILGSIWDLL